MSNQFAEPRISEGLQRGRLMAAVVGGLAAAILIVSLLATLTLAAGANPAIRIPFRLLCHGIVERSLVILDAAMPICARCTGIYLGMMAGAGIWLAVQRSGRNLAISTALAVILVMPLAIDGTTQAVGWRESTTALRMWSGVVAACAASLWLLGRARGVAPVAGRSVPSGEARQD